MGIEQIRMNQTKALPPAFEFNWSQMESNLVKGEVQLDGLDLCRREIVVFRRGDSWQGMLRIAY